MEPKFCGRPGTPCGRRVRSHGRIKCFGRGFDRFLARYRVNASGPVASKERNAPLSVQTPTPDIRARPIRILYADDVPELRRLVHTVFSLDHHEIECVEDGTEALERIDQHRDGYDLLITDHHMPRMDGLELVRHLRALAFAGRVMVFSSELDPGVTREYQQLGVDRILLKPLYPAELRQIVRELFPSSVSVAVG